MTQARNLSRLLNKKLQTFKYTATSGQTTFSDSDDDGLIMSYTPENMLVTYNGVVLESGSEYTATNGTSVVLDTGADSAAEVNVYAFESVSLGGYVPSTGGTFGGNVGVTGNLTVDTNTLFVDAANNRVGVGTSSPNAKLHVQNDIYATGKISLGELYLDPNPMLELSTDNLSSSYIESLDGTALNITAGTIYLNHGEFNTVLETYPFGVGVIGSIGADSATIAGNLTIADRIIHSSDTNTQIRFPAADTVSVETNGLERMRIDSAGRVTKPAQPAFTAYSSTGTLHTTVGAFPLQNTVINIGNHYNTSTYNFTAPIAGTYKFTISALVASGGHLSLLRNGSYVAGGSGGASGIHQVGATYAQVCKEFILTLAANDNIALYQENSNGVYRDWVVMTGYLLG